MSRHPIQSIRGVIPALLTPFDPNEEFCPRRTRELVRHLMQYELGGLYLTGSTGEGFMMTEAERMAAVEAVLEETQGRVPVIVHVGAISTRQSVMLARHAAQAGADAISSVPPIYWKFSDDAIAGYYADLTQAAGLPMIVYNIALAGLVSFDMVKRLGKIDGVAGIKYTAATHYDMFRIKECLGPDFMVYSGSDEMAMSGLLFGSDGLIGSTYNVLCDLFVRLYKAYATGEMEKLQTLQQAANTLIFAFLRYDLLPVLKLALSMTGVDAGIARRPFTRYTQEQAAAIREDFLRVKAELPGLDIDFLNRL